MVVSVGLASNQSLVVGLVPRPDIGDVAFLVGIVASATPYALLNPRLTVRS